MGRRYPDPERSHLRPCRCRFGSDRETQAVGPVTHSGQSIFQNRRYAPFIDPNTRSPLLEATTPPIEGGGSSQGSESLGSDSSTSSSGQALTMHQARSDSQSLRKSPTLQPVGSVTFTVGAVTGSNPSRGPMWRLQGRHCSGRLRSGWRRSNWRWSGRRRSAIPSTGWRRSGRRRSGLRGRK